MMKRSVILSASLVVGLSAPFVLAQTQRGQQAAPAANTAPKAPAAAAPKAPYVPPKTP